MLHYRSIFHHFSYPEIRYDSHKLQWSLTVSFYNSCNSPQKNKSNLIETACKHLSLPHIRGKLTFRFIPLVRVIRNIISHIQCHRCAYSDNKEKSIGGRWGYKNKTVWHDGSVVNSLWTENQYCSSQKRGAWSKKKHRNFKLKTIHIEIAIECVVRGWHSLVFFCNFVQSHQFWSSARRFTPSADT